MRRSDKSPAWRIEFESLDAAIASMLGGFNNDGKSDLLRAGFAVVEFKQDKQELQYRIAYC
jgi:hypothetical protein